MNRLVIAVVLCLVGGIVSGLLLLQHHGEGMASAAVAQVCGEGTASGCETVARSPYSVVLGVPLAAIGLFFYFSLLVLLTLGLLAPEVREQAAALALTLVTLALLLDVGLLALQAFAIRAFCKLCLLTYIINAAVVFTLGPARRAARGLFSLSSRVEGRLLLAGWVAGSLAVGAAVAGAHSTLTLRESARGRALIGLPVAAADATAAPAAPASAPGSSAFAATGPEAVSPSPALAADALAYKALAEKLQATLDDPQKLEQYFAAKAAQEFETAKVQTFDLNDVPFKGPTNAPVQIVEYSDFLCPFCRQLAGALSSFIPQAGNRVVVYYKNYPLDSNCNANLKTPFHVGACFVALGGVCAQFQGHFWQYAERVFATPLQNPTAGDVTKLATEAGLNGAALGACMEDPKTKERLTAEIAEAQRVGVTATPTVFINGKKLPRLQDFVPTVDKEAQKKGFAPLPANLR